MSIFAAFWLTLSVMDVQLLPWLTEYTLLGLFLLSVIFILSISALFNRDDYDHYRYVYINGHSFWTAI